MAPVNTGAPIPASLLTNCVPDSADIIIVVLEICVYHGLDRGPGAEPHRQGKATEWTCI